MKLKTHKATSKRFKVTKKGKVQKRTAGQDHFNAKEPGKVTRNKRKGKTITNKKMAKTIRMLIN